MHCLREYEGLPKAMVETNRDVTCDLDVLALVFAHGYFFGVVEQDVGSLKCGVREKTRRDEVTFALC